MGIWLMTAAANLVVGALVGLCGVAGFLLPMFYRIRRIGLLELQKGRKP